MMLTAPPSSPTDYVMSFGVSFSQMQSITCFKLFPFFSLNSLGVLVGEHLCRTEAGDELEALGRARPQNAAAREYGKFSCILAHGGRSCPDEDVLRGPRVVRRRKLLRLVEHFARSVPCNSILGPDFDGLFCGTLCQQPHTARKSHLARMLIVWNERQNWGKQLDKCTALYKSCTTVPDFSNIVLNSHSQLSTVPAKSQPTTVPSTVFPVIFRSASDP